MPLTLTVIVPALNEAQRLPKLLDQLSSQTQPPDQVVVADAGSTDGTREVATAAGACVVDGGMPAVGRNAGARVATGDLLLFLDADVEINPNFISDAVAEFESRSLSAATVHMSSMEAGARNEFACEVVNFYMDLMQYVAPHAPGFCILAPRAVHEAIGGFDEEVVLAEDHDYVQRAAEHGKFRVLQSVRASTSMRRIDKEGFVRLAFMYLYCELHVVTGRKIYELPFDYEFGSFEPGERTTALHALGALRTKLGTATEALATLSVATLEELRVLGERGFGADPAEHSLEKLSTEDVGSLEHYLAVRIRLVRRGSSRALREMRSAASSVWSEVRRIVE
ncbi:MAG: glycosyltransferase [Coriobacteriia bacterium]|nr:glycosyltransferase [Coriobacteriia bacterium]